MDPLVEDTELIRHLVAFTQLAPAQVAKRAGISASTINRPLNGTATTRLGRKVLDSLRAAFPDYPGWEAYLRRTAVTEERKPYKPPPIEVPAVLHEDAVQIREIDLHYGMGGNFLMDDVGVEKRVFSRAWLRTLTRASPESLFWTVGDGDSMEPTIRSGELILIDASQRHVRINDGVWAVALGEIGMVKRIHFAGAERVELLSDNQLIPPIHVGYEELHVIGRVVAAVRRM